MIPKKIQWWMIRQENGRFKLMDQPSTGWPFYPGTRRFLSDTIALLNHTSTQYQNDPTARMSLDPENNRILLETSANIPARIVLYGSHFVRWFPNEDAALRHIEQLKIARSERTWGNGLTGAGASYAAWALGIPAPPLMLMTAALTLTWAKVDEQKIIFYETCLARARIRMHNPDHPYFGMVEGPDGTHCLPEYRDGYINSRGR